MFVVTKFKSFFKNMSWGKAGVLLSLVIGYFTISIALHELKPQLLFEISNSVNIIDINKPLADLSISFQGEDIEKNNLNLRIYTLRMENIGEINILQDHYDKNVLWGFEIINGSIIELRLIGSNSDYLRNSLAPILRDTNLVELSKVIFEKEKYFILEVLILHDKDLTPEFNFLGKIAGIEEVKVTMRSEEKEKRSLTQQIFDIITTVLKGIAITAIVIAFIVSIGTIIDKIGDMKKRRQVKNRSVEAELLFGRLAGGDSVGEKVARDIFVHSGFEKLKQVESIMKKPEEITKILNYLRISDEFNKSRDKMQEKYSENIGDNLDMEFERAVMLYPHTVERRNPIISKLYRLGIIKLHNDEFEIDPEFKEAFDYILSIYDAK